jgi:hypothetical protein
VIRGRGRAGFRRGAPCAAALAIGLVAVVGFGCHRGTVPAGEGGATGTAPTPRRPIARREAPFAHPLLAGATTEVSHEDCSRPALSAVVGRVLAIEAKAAPSGRAGPPKLGTGEGCPSSAAGELAKTLRGELLPRVGGCVARDGPLDPQWDMVNSAVLSLGVCLDCPRPLGERTAQCRRARQVLGQAARTPR